MALTHQINGKITPTRTENLVDEQIYKALRGYDFAGFRILKGGVCKIDSLPAYDPKMALEAFRKSLTSFLAAENMSELEFTGHFLHISVDTAKSGADPVITKIIVDSRGVTVHEGVVIWKVED